MRVRYLGWAGLEVEVEGHTAVVDLVQDISTMAPYIREPHGPFLGPRRPGTAALALVTHLHFDHADPAAISGALVCKIPANYRISVLTPFPTLQKIYPGCCTVAAQAEAPTR